MASTSSNTSGSNAGRAAQKRKRNYPIFEKQNKENKAKRSKDEPLKIWSWNVAGLRGSIKKNSHLRIAESGAHIVSLQETKCTEMPNEISAMDEYIYKRLLASTEGAGHAGVALLAKEKPIKVTTGIGAEQFDQQGRYIQAEYDDFFLISIYVPNSGRGLVNLSRRARWDDLLLAKITELDRQKPVIIAGDMNVAHQEIDLRNPDSNRNKTAGFTDQERNAFTRLLEAGFVDVWRARNPDTVGYTYWSYIGNRKANNIGWRLDYFIVSERIYENVRECEILPDITGSDHCPISMVIDI